ncbi:hypothetical protein [Pseudomonas sp. Pseusp16]|uniref:hypothetical protein n=1 Tax=Pseudomonas sp. Pseusp16 TaxID=3243021 RepID=UPI0039B612BE
MSFHQRNIFWLIVFFMGVDPLCNVTLAAEKAPVVKIESRSPLSVSLLERGVKYNLSISKKINDEVEGIYTDLHLQDLNGDGMHEVVATLDDHGGVNQCSKAYVVNLTDYSLDNLVFDSGPLCNHKVDHEYLISSYRDGAIWREDIYKVEGRATQIIFADSCIGCGEVLRKKFDLGGNYFQYLARDNGDFKERHPIFAVVSSMRAEVFSSPGVLSRKYLTRGDKVIVVQVDDSNSGIPWIQVRFEGEITTDGWIKCSDIENCNNL